MGLNPTNLYSDQQHLNEFMYVLINDIKALDKMVADGMLECDKQRIGAEQELCLLDKSYRPVPIAMGVLNDLNDRANSTQKVKVMN